MKISRVEEMRNLDQNAVEKYGIIEELLMENAGNAAYFVILKEFGIKRKKFVIFCGAGNNGGDGLVVARKIHSNGGEVVVFIFGNPEKYKGAAKVNYEIARRLPIKILLQDALKAAPAEIQRSDAIIDAIFGTGLDREVGGIYREVITQINASGKTVFSLDIPSGVSGNSAQIMGTAIRADFTTTFGLPKIGNLLYPGFELGGKLSVTHISFPPQLYNQANIKIETNDPLPLPPRTRDTHKGNYGKVLFIAGSAHYYGAPYFAALSFLKAGGGLSFLATPEAVAPFIGNKGSEIIFVPQIPTPDGSIAPVNKAQLLEKIETMDLVVIGPGLSLNEETQKLVRELAVAIEKPLLIDGDGLTAVAQDLACIKNRKFPTILTPHLGEMARILHSEIKEISANKIDVLQQAAKSLNAILVLKGAHSLIGLPDKSVFINMTGNPGMATAGSGDVLTGTIAAMFSLGLPLEDAVRTGVFLHGFAGDLAAKKNGEDGVLASDIMNALPTAFKLYRADYELVNKDCYQSIHVV